MGLTVIIAVQYKLDISQIKHHIGQYYDQTQNHYEKWWNLKHSMALHYGIWGKNIRKFTDALRNTNQIMMDLADVQENDYILDAGCGVGGAAIFLAQKKNAQVQGVTLSELQVLTARKNVEKFQLESNITISKQDYSQTSFKSGSFDIIWACESLSSAENKRNFILEANRLLKPGGHIVIADYYLTKEKIFHCNLLKKWEDSWAMAELIPSNKLEKIIASYGFENIEIHDHTDEIYKTAKRMYRSYLLGKWPSKFYNLLFGASRYSRNHYKSGYYQYKALQAGLWKYKIILGVKK